LKIDTIANLTALREERLKEKESEWKNQPTKRLVWQVNYAKAVDLVPILKTMLKAYAIDPRFSIIEDKRTNKVIIEGISDALVESKAILDSLDRRKQQVLIEARIVEASSELSKTLSVTWGTRFGFEGNRGLANGLLFPNSLSGSVGGAGALGTSAPNPLAGKGATQLGTMAFSVGSINNLINIDAVLRAYETEALANVIASPRVVVQDQEKATIKEDITLSHSVLGTNEGRNTIATLELIVAPQVTSDNSLELDIQVQRQTPTNAPTDPVQGSIKRQANTKLIVSNGETAVIGGLYQTQKFKGQGRVPFLGRLPLIGALFGAKLSF
jgi:type IV pilus assembly protein PilQ